MRSAVILASLCLALSACSLEPEVDGERVSEEPFTSTLPPEVAASQMKVYINILVDRFDAQTCLDAQVLEYGGKRGDNGHEVHRSYQADLECLDAVEAELLPVGFELDGEQTYVATRDNGWVERVAFERDEVSETGTIKWVEVNP